jgi:hypothetical protein
MEGHDFDYLWHSRVKMSDRIGQECRVLDFDRLTNEVRVAFRDGVEAWVLRGCVRRKRGVNKR